MGVTTVIKDYGTDILNAIRENDLGRFKSILEKHLKSERKIQKLCISDIKHKPTKKFACPLILSARQDDPRILKYMMDRGVDPNFIHHTIYSSKRKEIVTALHIAVDLGLYDSVQILLDANADCNIGDHNQETPLHIAVKKADRILVRILLSKGADPQLLDRRGNAALHIATLYGHLQLVQTLLKYDADVYQKGQSGAIPPHIAAKEGHIHLIQLFCLQDVGNINIKIPCYADRREKAPIHLAAENGHVETIRALLSQFDADVNLRDSDKNTPLHCVVLNQYSPHRMREKDDFTESARMMLKARVSINEKNIYGDTALHLAAMNQFQKVVELLLAVGANPFLENDEHLKPIDVVPDFDPVTKQLLKNSMLGPRPPITASMDSLRKGYDLSPTPSDTHSLRKGHGIGYMNNSDPNMDHQRMDRSMSIASQSTMSIASSVFLEGGSRGLGPPPPPKHPPPTSRDQELNQSRSSKSRSQDSDDSIYNELNQKDTLPIYTRPNKAKKTSGQQTAGPQMSSTGQQTAGQHYHTTGQQTSGQQTAGQQTSGQQTEHKKVMSMGTQPEIYEDQMSIVSDISYTKERLGMADELQDILNRHRKHINVYDDDASETYSLQDTESEYMTVPADQRKGKPVPRPRSRSSSKVSSARQTPVMMEKPLPAHPEEKVYENIEYDEHGHPHVKPQRPPPRGVGSQQQSMMDQQQLQMQQMQEQMQKQIQQLQSLQLQQQDLTKKAAPKQPEQQKTQPLSLDQLPPGIKINRQQKGKPGEIEVQYGTGPITISLDTHGSQYSVQQNTDGLTYLVSEDGQFKYSLNDMLDQHNTVQTTQHVYVPEYQGDLSADLDDTELETNSIMSNDTQQEAVRQAIQQKVVELTETRYGDAHNPDISQILQEEEDMPKPVMTPTKQARKPRKDTPARPSLQKNTERQQQQVVHDRKEEEEDISPDQSPNASPKYKNFQQALAFAKSQQIQLAQKQQEEHERLLEEQRMQQEELQEYLRHQQEQLEQEGSKQQRKVKKQGNQLQKILENQNMVSTPETKRWHSNQSPNSAVVENTREQSPQPTRQVQIRQKNQWPQQTQRQREPRPTSQYMSSDFPSSSVEDLIEKEPSYPSDDSDDDEDEETEDVHPALKQQVQQEQHQLSQKSHDLYYSITPPGLGSKTESGPGSSQPEHPRPFVIQPAPSNKVSETPSSESSSAVSIDNKADQKLQKAQVNEVQILESTEIVIAKDTEQVQEIERAASMELLQDYEQEPGSHHARSQSVEFLSMSPRAGRSGLMSPTRSLGARTPDSMLSVGSSGSGLNMRVTGEMPKAYTRRTKASARTAFMKAPPQGIESSSECSDVEYLASSPYERTAPTQYANSPVQPTSSLSPTSPLSTSPPSSTGSPPDGKDPKRKKELLGASIPKAYKSFGKIEPKIDALMEALEAASLHGLSDFDDEDINESREHDLEVFTEIPVIQGSPKAIRPRPAAARPVVEARVTPEKEEIKAMLVEEPEDMQEKNKGKPARPAISRRVSKERKEAKSSKEAQYVVESRQLDEAEEIHYSVEGNQEYSENVAELEAVSDIPTMQGSPRAIRPTIKAKPRNISKKKKPINTPPSLNQDYVGEEEIQMVEESDVSKEQAGEAVAKSSFKKNIKVREDGPETYVAEAVEQKIQSPMRKKTVTVKEQKWQGENVIETYTTTVKTGEVAEAEKLTMAEIINSSQGEESSSESSESSESSDEGVMEYKKVSEETETGKFTVLTGNVASAVQKVNQHLQDKYETGEDEDEEPFTQQADTVKKRPPGRDADAQQMERAAKKKLPLTGTSSDDNISRRRALIETPIHEEEEEDEDELFRQQLKQQASQLSQKQGWKRGSQELHPPSAFQQPQTASQKPLAVPGQAQETVIDSLPQQSASQQKVKQPQGGFQRPIAVQGQTRETDIDSLPQEVYSTRQQNIEVTQQPQGGFQRPIAVQGQARETDIDSLPKEVYSTSQQNIEVTQRPQGGFQRPLAVQGQARETDIDSLPQQVNLVSQERVNVPQHPHETDIDVDHQQIQQQQHAVHPQTQQQPKANQIRVDPHETDIDADLDLKPTKLPSGEPPRRHGGVPAHLMEEGLPQHNMSTDLADQEVAFLSAAAEEKKQTKKNVQEPLQLQESSLAQPQLQQQPPVDPNQKPVKVQGRRAARKQQQQPQAPATHIPATVFKSYEEEEDLEDHQEQVEAKPPTQVLPTGFAAPEKSKKKGGFWSLSSMRKKKDKGVKGSQENLSAKSGDDETNRATTPEDKKKKKGLFGKRKGEKSGGDQPTLIVEMPVTPEVQHLAISPEKVPSSGGSAPSTPTSLEGFEGTVMGAPSGSNLDRSDTIRESGKEGKRKAGFFSLGSMRSKKKDKGKGKGEEYGAVPYTESTEDLSQAGEQYSGNVPANQHQQAMQQQQGLPMAISHNQEYNVQKQNEVFDVKQYQIPQQQQLDKGKQQPMNQGLQQEDRTMSETNLDEIFALEQQQQQQHSKAKKPPRPRYASQETNLDDVPMQQNPYSQSTPDFQNAAFAAVMGVQPAAQRQQQKRPTVSTSDLMGPEPQRQQQKRPTVSTSDLMGQMWAQQQGNLPQSQSSEQLPPDAQYEQQQLPSDVQYGAGGGHPIPGRRFFKKHEKPLQPIKHINKSLEDVAFASLKNNLQNGNGKNGHKPYAQNQQQKQEQHPMHYQQQQQQQQQHSQRPQQQQHQWQPQPGQQQQHPQRPQQQQQQWQPQPGQQQQQQKQPPIDDAQRVAQMWKENQDHKDEMEQILQSVSDVAMFSTGEDALKYEGHPSDDGSSLQSASGTNTPIQWGSTAGTNKSKQELEALAVAAGLQDIVKDIESGHDTSLEPYAETDPCQPHQTDPKQRGAATEFSVDPRQIHRGQTEADIQQSYGGEGHVDEQQQQAARALEQRRGDGSLVRASVEIPAAVKDTPVQKISQQEVDRTKAPSPKPSVPQKPANLKWGAGTKPKIAAKPGSGKPSMQSKPAAQVTDIDDIEATEGGIPSLKPTAQAKPTHVTDIDDSEDTEATIPRIAGHPMTNQRATPQHPVKDLHEEDLRLSEGPVEPDRAPLQRRTPPFQHHPGLQHGQHGGTPEVVDLDSFNVRAPNPHQQAVYVPSARHREDPESPAQQPQEKEKVRRKKAKKPNEDMRYKDAMSDTEVSKQSRKRKSLEHNVYSDAEAFDMEVAPRDQGKTLQEAALESITAGLAHQPRPSKPHKPWWQESDRPINYTRGVYRPPDIQFRPNIGDGGSGRYNDSHIASRTWSERSGNFATGSEGEADTEEYPHETSFDVGPLRPQVQQHQQPQPYNQRYSTFSNDSVFIAPPASPAHSSVSSSKRVTIVEGKKGKGKKKKKRDKPPSIMEPGPVDFSQYPVTARLWMEQVDKKTVQKSKTMSLMVMPEGMQPPEELRRNLPPYVSTSDDVFLPPQWVIARGRTLRKKSKRSSSSLSIGRNTSMGADSDVEGQPERPMSPGSQTLLFFRVGSNWRDLAWILFDGIYNEQETLRLIKDIQLKNPGDLSKQVRDMMHRWWKKKKSDATVEELQRALDVVNLGYIQEEMLENQKNSLTSFTDTEDDLDISEVSDTDPDVSRLIGEYTVRSMNNSFDCENAPDPPYSIPPEQMMARLSQKGMLRSGQSRDSLGHRSTYTQDSSRDSLLDDGDRKFMIVTPQLKHADYRHETTI